MSQVLVPSSRSGCIGALTAKVRADPPENLGCSGPIELLGNLIHLECAPYWLLVERPLAMFSTLTGSGSLADVPIYASLFNFPSLSGHFGAQGTGQETVVPATKNLGNQTATPHSTPDAGAFIIH
ncbi:hypothetical protein BO78DRAFT_416931 [Aspergillus sclerotiicarbonarius CBS 121057]|uniref:Uncharacterized protein n=1 Tax=Aspergillus sclerotiicarbonarius (strain CBS 121057 / IBT 28362) TaxID=1448318 RepID=A0A319FJV8_ASPSB|nr:hypothetical protein BO78DRAFT_416931 [Aspergillus sclerotiicarbonarius CBS 121057]